MLSAKHGVSENDAQRVSPPPAASHGWETRLAKTTPADHTQLYPITDPLLTPTGRRQAMTLGGVFAHEAAHGMPLPTRFFVSPMRRPGETLGLEWGWLFKAGAVSRPGSRPGSPARSRRGSRSASAASSAAPSAPGSPRKRDGPTLAALAPQKDPAPLNNVRPEGAFNNVRPAVAATQDNVTLRVTEPSPTDAAADASEDAHVRAVLAGSAALALPSAQGGMSHGVPGVVIEELREHLHVHECDKRLTLTELRALFPHFAFPEGPDEDSVWQPLSARGRETEDEMVARAAVGLAKLFDLATDDRYVSLTAHSGLLRAVYKNLGVPYRRLVTGEMNVLVIRVRRIELPNGRSTAL